MFSLRRYAKTHSSYHTIYWNAGDVNIYKYLRLSGSLAFRFGPKMPVSGNYSELTCISTIFLYLAMASGCSFRYFTPEVVSIISRALVLPPMA